MTSFEEQDLPTLVPALRSWLRDKEAGGGARLDREQVALLLDELGRLGQSADRLRKQNRKLRRRHGEPTEAADEPTEAED